MLRDDIARGWHTHRLQTVRAIIEREKSAPPLGFAVEVERIRLWRAVEVPIGPVEGADVVHEDEPEARAASVLVVVPRAMLLLRLPLL